MVIASSVVGTILIILAVVMVYFIYKKKLKQSRELLAKVEALRWVKEKEAKDFEKYRRENLEAAF